MCFQRLQTALDMSLLSWDKRVTLQVHATVNEESSKVMLAQSQTEELLHAFGKVFEDWRREYNPKGKNKSLKKVWESKRKEVSLPTELPSLSSMFSKKAEQEDVTTGKLVD